jgi:hypothetical protein
LTRRFDQVLHHGKVRPEIILLEYHADVTDAAHEWLSRQGSCLKSNLIAGDLQLDPSAAFPAGSTPAADELFPAPLGPSSTKVSPCWAIQRDVKQRLMCAVIAVDTVKLNAHAPEY